MDMSDAISTSKSFIVCSTYLPWEYAVVEQFEFAHIKTMMPLDVKFISKDYRVFTL